MINEVLNKMKENDMKTINYENGEPYIQEPAKTILEMELKKLLSIYKAEFIQYVDKQKEEQLDNASVTTYESEEMDAHGHYGGVEFSAGIDKFLKGLFEEKYFPMRYTIDETGAIRYDSNGQKVEKFDFDLIGKEGEKHLLTDEERIENNIGIYDYFVCANIKDMSDLEIFLDVMPHEAMHVFGFKGGIFEGVTEGFTREIAAKYNIRLAPFAHNEETKLIQKIEKVVGRNVISKNSYVEGNKGGGRYDEISSSIDEKLNITTDDKSDLFKKVCEFDDEYFTTYRSNKKDERLKEIAVKEKHCMKELNQELDVYIEMHPDRLYKLGENNVELNEEQEKARQLQYESIVSLQNKEIQSLKEIILNLGKEKSISAEESENDDFMKKLKNNVNEHIINSDTKKDDEMVKSSIER